MTKKMEGVFLFEKRETRGRKKVGKRKGEEAPWFVIVGRVSWKKVRLRRPRMSSRLLQVSRNLVGSPSSTLKEGISQ
jgi:hypothetical protein